MGWMEGCMPKNGLNFDCSHRRTAALHWKRPNLLIFGSCAQTRWMQLIYTPFSRNGVSFCLCQLDAAAGPSDHNSGFVCLFASVFIIFQRSTQRTAAQTNQTVYWFGNTMWSGMRFVRCHCFICTSISPCARAADFRPAAHIQIKVAFELRSVFYHNGALCAATLSQCTPARDNAARFPIETTVSEGVN